MHELSILVEIVRVVEEQAKQQKIDKVKAIVLQVGELSAVVPLFMQEYFSNVVDGNSLFEDAELEIETVPGIARCSKCAEEFNVVENEGWCPKCGSYDKVLIRGGDLFIKEILVPA